MNLRFLTRSAVLLLAIAILAAFVAQVASPPGRTRVFTLVEEWGIFVPALALEQPWRWITSAFLHGGFMHLFFNLWALILFGQQLESILGSRRVLYLFFGGAIAGDVGYLATGGTAPALGASGAIYTLMGTLAILRPRMTIIMFPLYFPMPLIAAIFFWAVLDVFRVFVPSGIAGGAHLGGLVLGLWAGFYLLRRPHSAARGLPPNDREGGRRSIFRRRPSRSRPEVEERVIVAPTSRALVQAPPQEGAAFACRRCGYVATSYSEVESPRCPGCGEVSRWKPL